MQMRKILLKRSIAKKENKQFVHVVMDNLKTVTNQNAK